MKLSINPLPIFIAALLACALPASGHAQRGGQRGNQTPRAAAPIELTGHWVSVISEDWKYRMVTPPKGEYGAVPISAAGRRVADAWDPAKDETAGEQCKAFGAAAIMRMPGRLRIAWETDNTLRIETDAGTQTRQLRFDGSQPQQAGASSRTWQGHSAAQWQAQGNLKVVTTQMRPGYLRKNGVPYSENAVLTEYYERATAPNKDELLIVTTIVEDSLYLNSPFVTSTHFKKLPDATGWNPTPCSR
jgi:hypothetical protein